MRTFVKSVVTLLALTLAACSGPKVQDYTNSTPKLDLKTFFNGELKAYGILEDRQGSVTRKFSANIKAWWEGDTGYLDETFYFDDGEESKRFWTLKIDDNGKVSGDAGDVVGKAKGQVSGNTLRWQYTLEIPYKNDTINVFIDDWLYLVTDNRLINKSDLTKFGFKVGELTLVIEK
ncbi:MAG: DUF3833 domain-containing protein [Agarilytica sp.]